jgi:hypothetical protein
VGLKLPSSKAADVLAPTGADAQNSKITSMFALQQDAGHRKVPTVLAEDRFPCAWVEWKGLLGGTPGSALLVSKDEVRNA